MKKIYLALAIIGFILPNIFVFKTSIETGNYLLYTDILSTFEQMFANDVSSAFIVDLLFVVALFFWGSYRESQKLGMQSPWLVWVLTMLFGIAFGLPLFLYKREVFLENKLSTTPA